MAEAKEAQRAEIVVKVERCAGYLDRPTSPAKRYSIAQSTSSETPKALENTLQKRHRSIKRGSGY
jgi:hypothetical protein